MSPRLFFTTARSNLLRLTLSVAAAAVLSAGAEPAPAGARIATAKADGQRSDRLVATASAAKRRSGARKIRTGQRPAKGHAAGRKVG